MALVIIPFIASLVALASAGNFYNDFAVTFGNERAKILNGGRDLTLSLDKYSGSGFQSKNDYLFGRFDVQIKLVPGNSAGTVTTYYGKGNREQQFFLWFDPTTSFHTYSIVWNAQRIIFLVDNIPIRVFSNNEAIGVPFPKSQPMRVYSSLWNADDWATQGGRVKTDWTQAPFTASYHNINIDANCVATSSASCGSKSTNSLNAQAWKTQDLDSAGRNRLRWVQQKYMIYNYCTDLKRFPQGLLPECKQSTY